MPFKHGQVNVAGSELNNLLCNHSLSKVGSSIVTGYAEVDISSCVRRQEFSSVTPNTFKGYREFIRGTLEPVGFPNAGPYQLMKGMQEFFSKNSLHLYFLLITL